jgi:predicted RNase H-like nuclease (RuvC/YqgF family)
VSDKLIDKERSLEEEIQLRERVQLQLKQAERSVEDLTMELQTAAQTKEDLVKQLKQAQVGAQLPCLHLVLTCVLCPDCAHICRQV